LHHALDAAEAVEEAVLGVVVEVNEQGALGLEDDRRDLRCRPEMAPRG